MHGNKFYVADTKLLLLKYELSKSIISFEKKENGTFSIYYNNHSGYQEFKDNLNHTYYEFIKEVQENLRNLNSMKEGQIYCEMLMHLFELLDEQIGTYPDFVTPHRNTKMVSRINTKVTCIYTNPEDINQLLIYFQHQKKIIRKSIKFIQTFSRKCSKESVVEDSNTLPWKDELKEFYPEMTRIKNEVNKINNIHARIEYLGKERDRLNEEFNKNLYSSPINFFFESRIECLKDVLVFMNQNEDHKQLKDESLLEVKKTIGFKWSESKAALVELIYAIYYSNALNAGKGNIKELAELFEHFFDIELGNIYHIFHELKYRKLEPAKFIDSLKSAFLRKIDEENDR